MPPRKRKADAQPKLEEVVDEDVKVLKSKAGQNDSAKVEPEKEGAVGSKEDKDDDQDMFAKRRAKKTGVSSAPKKQATAPAEPNHGSSNSGIWVNRAPVLTLWVSVVAQQQGFGKEAGKLRRHLSLPVCSACCYRNVQSCMSVNAEQRSGKSMEQRMVNDSRKPHESPKKRAQTPSFLVRDTIRESRR